MSNEITTSQEPFAVEIKRLRDQVEVLQVRATDPKQPWFRQPALLTSIAAVVISILVPVVGFVVQSQARSAEEQQAGLVRLSEITQEVEQSDRRIANAVAMGATDQAFVNSQEHRVQRLLGEEATAIVEGLASEPSSGVWMSYGLLQHRSGKLEAAMESWTAALKTADGFYEQAIASGALGQLLMMDGSPVFGSERGRTHWEHAVENAEQMEGAYGTYTKINFLLSWVTSELALGETERARGLLEQAEEAHSGLPVRFEYREEQGQSIQNAHVQLDIPIDLRYVYIDAHCTGAWRWESEERGIYGLATFSLRSDGTIRYRDSIYTRDGYLVDVRSGVGEPTGQWSARIYWTGQYSSLGQQFGHVDIEVAAVGDTLQCTLAELDYESENQTWHREPDKQPAP